MQRYINKKSGVVSPQSNANPPTPAPSTPTHFSQRRGGGALSNYTYWHKRILTCRHISIDALEQTDRQTDTHTHTHINTSTRMHTHAHATAAPTRAQAPSLLLLWCYWNENTFLFLFCMLTSKHHSIWSQGHWKQSRLSCIGMMHTQHRSSTWLQKNNLSSMK